MTLSNSGSRTAFDVKVYREDVELKSFDQLLPGASVNFTDTVSNRDLRDSRVEIKWSATWVEPGVDQKSIDSNVLPLNYNLGRIALPEFTIMKNVTTIDSEDSTFLKVDLTISNLAESEVRLVKVVDTLPNGIIFVNAYNNTIN